MSPEPPQDDRHSNLQGSTGSADLSLTSPLRFDFVSFFNILTSIRFFYLRESISIKQKHRQQYACQPGKFPVRALLIRVFRYLPGSILPRNLTHRLTTFEKNRKKSPFPLSIRVFERLTGRSTGLTWGSTSPFFAGPGPSVPDNSGYFDFFYFYVKIPFEGTCLYKEV